MTESKGLDIEAIEEIMSVKSSINRLLGHSNEFKESFHLMSEKFDALNKILHEEVVARQNSDSLIIEKFNDKISGIYRSVAASLIIWLFTIVSGIFVYIINKI